MQKGLFAVFWIVFFVLAAEAQMPLLKPSATPWFVENSAFRKEFTGKYDFVMAYYQTGGWSSQEFYYSILAFQDNKWYKIVYTCDKNFGKGQPAAKLEKELINKRTVDSIISVLDANSFWKLDNNELNKTSDGKYYDTDAHKYLDRRVYISDGLTDVFEIISKNIYRVTYSYEPDAYFKMLPGIKERGLFVNARRAFLSVFPNVWQPPSK